jgi:hypothetical protein
MKPQTHTINGQTFEPLPDYLRGWIPGVLGLPMANRTTSFEITRGWVQGGRDRHFHGLRSSCITNMLWHAILQNQCRKVKS